MYLGYSVISSNVIVLSMVIQRDKVNIYMFPWKEVISQCCIRYRGVVAWNAILKSKINPDTSEFVFAKALKACILDGNLTI